METWGVGILQASQRVVLLCLLSFRSTVRSIGVGCVVQNAFFLQIKKSQYVILGTKLTVLVYNITYCD
jgi:hypothetical protein